jgi:hypothetical protein
VIEDYFSIVTKSSLLGTAARNFSSLKEFMRKRTRGWREMLESRIMGRKNYLRYHFM